MTPFEPTTTFPSCPLFFATIGGVRGTQGDFDGDKDGASTGHLLSELGLAPAPAMDYNLAALKVFCCQLKEARLTSSSTPPAMTIFGILFQRAWVQGVLVSGSEEGRFLLDDGSAVVELSLANESQPQNWTKGLYVMVVGLYVPATSNGRALIKVHKIVDLSPYPDREAMWHLEVVEACQLFYLPSLE